MVALRTLTAFEAENGNGRVQAPPPERRAPALREPGRDTAQRRRSTLRWRRGLLWAWVTALLFIIWKHGFVMVERRHVVFFFGFVLMLTPALEVLPCIPRAARSWARGLGATACLLILATLQSLFFPDNLSPLIRPFSSFRDNLRTLLKPTEYARLMQQRQAAELAHFQVPRLRQMIGGASVDVFGQFQSYALFNGMNYRPRPVLQSFVAYNRPLMRLNEQFYASKAAPEYVLFDLAPILYRFPPLEDGWALRGLLLNYEPLAMEDSFLLLKARAAQAPKLTLLGEGIVRQGEPIDLRPYGDADIWMEIYVEPTWAGRLRQFFFQPARTRLAAWRTPRKDRIIKSLAPAPMLAAGFLASPLVLNNEDVLDLYTGNAVTRPGAYSVELTPEQRRFWQDTVRYRLYRIENRLGRCAPADLAWRLRYPGFGSAPAEVIAPLKQVVTIGGQPALELPRGGSLRFTIPPGAKAVSGSFALGREVYADGAAGNGVEFRLEEESGNGAVQLLHAETLQPSANPADQALRPFTAALTGEGERKLILKAVTSPAGEPASVPVCWGGIRFVME